MLTGKKISDKEYEHVLNVWNNIKLNENLQLYSRWGLKLKTIYRVIRIQSVSVAKTINRIQHTKRIEVEKSGEKMEKRCTN